MFRRSRTTRNRGTGFQPVFHGQDAHATKSCAIGSQHPTGRTLDPRFHALRSSVSRRNDNITSVGGRCPKVVSKGGKTVGRVPQTDGIGQETRHCRNKIGMSRFSSGHAGFGTRPTYGTASPRLSQEFGTTLFMEGESVDQDPLWGARAEPGLDYSLVLSGSGFHHSQSKPMPFSTSRRFSVFVPFWVQRRLSFHILHFETWRRAYLVSQKA